MSVTDILEPFTPVGEITIVRRRLHGTAINCMIVPYQHPEEWSFKQFPTEESVAEYALTNHLVMKKETDGNDQSE